MVDGLRKGQSSGAASALSAPSEVVIRVAVDALGGDLGPDEVIAGALAARSDHVLPVIFGPTDIDPQGLPFVEAPEFVAMEDKPAEAVRAKPNSSLVRSVRAVGEGLADTVVSAGNTGAVLAASFLHLRRLEGVHRPGIAAVLPTLRGPMVFIDAGANADARPEHLLQFGLMGQVFAEEVLGIAQPEVRLLSIGEESEKGNQLLLDSYALLAEQLPGFAGNAEGNTILEGSCDVLVCDGFTGNVTLKTLEGTIRTLFSALGSEITATGRGKLGGWLIRPAARRLRRRFDPEEYGGAYLLGLRELVVVAHGSSSRTAIANAIRLAARGVEHRIADRLRERLPERVVKSSRSRTLTGNK
jgi:glycerol-3-phosphate acyltransferase PlsX